MGRGKNSAKFNYSRGEIKASSAVDFVQLLKAAKTPQILEKIVSELKLLNRDMVEKVAVGYTGLKQKGSKADLLLIIKQTFYNRRVLDSHDKIAREMFQDKASDKESLKAAIRNSREKKFSNQIRLLFVHLIDGGSYADFIKKHNISRNHLSALLRRARKYEFDKKYGVELKNPKLERSSERFEVPNAVIKIYKKTTGSGVSSKAISTEELIDRVAAMTGKRPTTNQVHKILHRYRRGQIVLAKSQMYKIPSSVQKAAKQGLELRSEYKRGGTKVGLNTARILSRGGEIGFAKVKHISEYFPRHEVDKQGKDWDKPSNGKIAWLLWGGDAGWKWSKAIVEKNKETASISPDLAKKIFEAAGLESSEEELAWFGRKSRAVKKAAPKDRKELKTIRKAQRKRLYEDDPEALKEEMNKLIKPIWSNIDMIAKKLGFDYAKSPNPKYNYFRKTFDIDVLVPQHIFIAPAQEIVEERMKRQNEYGITGSALMSIRSIGVKDSVYFINVNFNIAYMTDNDERASLKIDKVFADADAKTLLRKFAKELKDKFSTIERENLRVLMLRTANKIRVAK